MIQDFFDEILSDSPLYTIRDSNGNVINDNVDIALKTPLVQEGTALNRAMFRNFQGDLYTQDRYNAPSNISYNLIESGGTDNIFLKNWIPVNAGLEYEANDGTKLTVSGAYSTSTRLPTDAVDANLGSGWRSDSNTIAWLQIELPKPYKITKINTHISNGSASYFSEAKIQGSKNGESWQDLASITERQTNAAEMQLSNADFYKFYRIYVTNSSATYASIYHFEVLEYASKYGYVNNLNLPLTSYEKGKSVNIVGEKAIPPVSVEYITQDVFPTSWTVEEEYIKYSSPDGFILSASDTYDNVSNACDGRDNSYWRSAPTRTAWINMKLPENIIPTKMKLKFTARDLNYLRKTIIKGKKGEEWHELLVFNFDNDIPLELTEYTLDNTLEFSELQIDFSFSSSSEQATVYEWQVTQYAVATDYIESFYNPYLNVNNLGAKQINGIINHGEKYSLVYNGESWDIENMIVVNGKFTINHPSTSPDTEHFIDLGRKPKIVILYSRNNNNASYIATTSTTGTAYGGYIPMILGQGYSGTRGRITDDGFCILSDVSGQHFYNYVAII